MPCTPPPASSSRPGKGILAADESTGTIGKRFDTIDVENTEPNRRAYRQMLFTTPGFGEHLSGVILYDETIRQSADDGRSFVDVLVAAGSIPGIKVDTGAKPLAGFPGETVTEGLDGLRERMAEYRELGARFAKWRAPMAVGGDLPTDFAILANMHAMARYAALCQEADVVPIVEPEILMDGDHDLAACEAATGSTLAVLFEQLAAHRVDLAGTLLKVNMIVPGKGNAVQDDDRAIAEATIRVPHGVRAARGPRGRVPVRRHDRRAGHQPPQRDEPARRGPVGAVVQLRARAAGALAPGVARRPGERRGGAARARAPRPDERARAQRGVRRRDGICRLSLTFPSGQPLRSPRWTNG